MTTYRQAEVGARLRGVAERTEPIPERVLWRLWKKRAALHEGLRTEAGRRVRVLYPGRPGTSACPDFRDALLEIEGLGLVRGDVELHLRQRDWAAHGHSTDPNYNGVVVHGALQVDTAETPLQNGGRVPMVSLDGLLSLSSPDEDLAPKLGLWPRLARHGFSKPETAEEAGELLDRAGDQRFRVKAAAFRRFIEEQGPDQTLYEALMEGLGYRHNRQPFLRLAYLAPYEVVKNAAVRLPESGRGDVIASWLLAVSDLGLPTDSRARPPGLRRTMAKTQWHLFRVRPANHPAVRIRGAAELISRYLSLGLVQGLEEAAQTGTLMALIKVLVVKAPGQGTCIGTDRAKDLAVNAVLPFLQAHSAPTAQPKYFSLFHECFKSQDNEVVREMTAELLPPDWKAQVNNARRQQGLLHLAALLRGTIPRPPNPLAPVP